MKTRPLYLSLALCAAALVSTGPASSETYEGCLTPGGSLVQVGPASANKICPPPAKKITLGGSGGSGGFSGWEIVQAQKKDEVFNGNQLRTLDADCPAGKKPLGGGGLAQNGISLVSGEIVLQTSAPYDDASGAGWEVSFYHTNSANSGFADLLTFAICATVN